MQTKQSNVFGDTALVYVRNAAWKVSKNGVISCPHFPAFGLNTERYEISLRIQSECGKKGLEITSYLDIFYAKGWFRVNRICKFTWLTDYF